MRTPTLWERAGAAIDPADDPPLRPTRPQTLWERAIQANLPTPVDPEEERLRRLAARERAMGRSFAAEGTRVESDPTRRDPLLTLGILGANLASPSGEILSALDAKQQFDEGNYGMAALSAAGAVPFVGALARGARVAGSAVDAVKAAKGAGKVAASNLTDESVAKVFDDMTPDEAMRAAQRGQHLKQNPTTGQYIGAPRGLDSPSALRTNRARVDGKVADGLDNGPWYDRGRAAISEVSGYDAATMAPTSQEGLMASFLARGGAAYSPKAAPDQETNNILKQYIAKTISGVDVKPGMVSQAENVRRGVDIDPFTGRVKLTPAEIELGPKTGGYADAKDPTVPDESLFRTANDIWHGRVMGYRGDAKDPDALFDRGFTGAEHGFLTGENLLTAARANARGIQPPGFTGNFTWTPRRVQAATWGAERRADAIKMMDEADAKYELALAEFNRKVALGQRAKLPVKPVRMTEEELTKYANYGVDDGIDAQTASITPEFAPGGGTGLLTGFNELPEAVRNDFSRQSIAASGRYNPVLKALDQYQKPVETVKGSWVDNITGETESNLVDVAKPLVATNVNVVRPAVGKKPAVTTAKRLTPASKAMMEITAAIEGVSRGQQGVGMRHFMPANSSFRATEKTGARLAGNPTELANAKAALEAGGLDVLDDGDGLLVGRFAPEGQTWNDELNGVEVQAAIKKALKGGTYRVEITPGRLQAGLMSVPWGEEGSGQVARFLDDQLSRPDVVQAAQRLDRGGVPEVLDARYNIAEEFGRKQGLPIRPDMQKLMNLISQPNGFTAFQEYIKRNGTAGLPAIALMFGAGATARSGRQDER